MKSNLCQLVLINTLLYLNYFAECKRGGGGGGGSGGSGAGGAAGGHGGDGSGGSGNNQMNPIARNIMIVGIFLCFCSCCVCWMAAYMKNKCRKKKNISAHLGVALARINNDDKSKRLSTGTDLKMGVGTDISNIEDWVDDIWKTYDKDQDGSIDKYEV